MDSRLRIPSFIPAECWYVGPSVLGARVSGIERAPAGEGDATRLLSYGHHPQKTSPRQRMRIFCDSMEGNPVPRSRVLQGYLLKLQRRYVLRLDACVGSVVVGAEDR